MICIYIFSKVEFVYEGECEVLFFCYCFYIYNFVCGNDGEIYDNSCFMGCK